MPSKEMFNIAESRCYRFLDITVPPKQYAQFLWECVSVFEEIVLRESKCKSLEELREKYAKMMRKSNPTKSEKELKTFDGPPIELWFGAELGYNKGFSHSRKPDKPYRSVEWIESLSLPNPEERAVRFPPRQSKINLKSTKEDLVVFVNYINEELDRRFRRRKGGVPWDIFRDKKKEDNGAYYGINHFRFDLRLESDPISLSTDISLINSGASMGNRSKPGHLTPAIEVKTDELFATSMRISRRMVESIGEVVTKHYKPFETEHVTKYTLMRTS